MEKASVLSSAAQTELILADFAAILYQEELMCLLDFSVFRIVKNQFSLRGFGF